MNKDRFDELAEIWFKTAQDDFLWAKDSFKSGYFGGACFVCQQIAEKALKAYLFFQKQKLVRTHDLERLLEKCIGFDKKFVSIRKNCHILNNYYTDTRYPDIWDVTRFEDEKLAKEALKLAKDILDFVSKKVEINCPKLNEQGIEGAKKARTQNILGKK